MKEASFVGRTANASARLRPARRQVISGLVALVALAAFMALGASSAFAIKGGAYSGKSFGPDGTPGTKFLDVQSITVDQKTEDVYVFDRGAGGKIYRFDATGAPKKFSALPGNVIEEVGTSSVSGGTQVAVDASAGPAAGDIYAASFTPGVQIFASTGAKLGTLNEENGSLCGVGVSPSGHVFTSTYPGLIREYAPTANPVADSDLIGTSVTEHSAGCNVLPDGLGNIYRAGFFGHIGRTPGLSSTEDIEVDPSGITMAIDPSTNELISNRTDRIVKYNSVGDYLTEFGFSGPGAISGSFGVGVNGTTGKAASGNYYVSSGTGYVSIFSATELPTTKADPAPAGPTHDQVTVSGTINPDSTTLSASCKVELGTDTGYTLPSVPCTTPTVPAGKADVAVTANLTGLTAETTYHYRFSSTNANGTTFSQDRNYKPTAVFATTTKPATEIKENVGTLNGSVDPDGIATSFFFEYGKTDAYGQKTATGSAGSGSGATPVSSVVTDFQAESLYHYRLVATNVFGTSYGADLTLTTLPAVEGVTTGDATDIGTTSATLSGSIVLRAEDTHYYFEVGPTTSYGQQTPPPPGGDAGSGSGSLGVSASVTNLQPGSVYHYRLVGSNQYGVTYGADKTFTAKQPPSIDALLASEVTATSATLSAEINPHGYATTYRFEYGPTNAFGQVAPVPDGTLGPETTPQSVSVALDDLQSGIVYHFRLVAESIFGTTTTPEQTFAFYPPPCPNGQVRQQTGSSRLPDCRAYELVSPGDTGAIMLMPGAAAPTYATNPARFAFGAIFGVLPGAGDAINDFGDLYVSTRSDTGWTTKYVGLRSNEALISGGRPNEGQPGVGYKLSDLTLSTFMDWNDGNQNFVGPQDIGSYAPYLWNSNGDPLGRLPTNLDSVPGGTKFVGDVKNSPDFSNVAISAGAPAFVPGAQTTVPGSAYDNDRETNQIHLISLTADNNPIQQDPAGPKDPNEYILFPGFSKDGSHILMSTAAADGNVHLYMRVNDQVTYEVSAGLDRKNHGVDYVGMTSDGSQVFFTSSEKLTADDHDTSNDLFVWRQSEDSLTRLSVGESGSGDTDSCVSSSDWTSKCGVIPVAANTVSYGFSPSPLTDTMMGSENGEIYFYSPELLDGVKGLFNKRNLYVYRHGHPQYVATFDDAAGGDPIRRIQVSPDASHTAFITSSQMTAYDNAGHAMMYTYNPESRAIRCVSCLPSGEPPQADVEGSQSGIFQTFDGRTFFSTTDPLVPQDTGGFADVYEFVEGRPQLISSGISSRGSGIYGVLPAGLVGVSGNGQNVYFSTYDTLVRDDHNGAFLKFYDARTGGGFPTAPEAAPCAAADECHGPGSSPAAVPQVGSDVHLGNRGNMPAKKHKKHKKKQQQKKQGKKKAGKKQKKKKKASKTRRAGR